MAEGAREFFGVSFITALIPVKRALPSQHKHLPKSPPPNIITLGIRISAEEFGVGRAEDGGGRAQASKPQKQCFRILCTGLSHLGLSSGYLEARLDFG